jgi:glutamate dehydrogenase
VDLLFNGGIGTYVKATEETSEEVGDRSNDSVRVDGSQLRARIVVEGGNLGFTQRGRIEYAESGGRINTDFIDNSAGVNCSDREVNLKILLRLAEGRGQIERLEGEKLLAGAADSVVEAILRDSLAQAQLLAREELASADRMDAYEALMVSLEAQGMLIREMECLPSTPAMTERARAGSGLSLPELAVLVAYSKRSLAEAVFDSDLPDSISLLPDLAAYFPPEVSERFSELIWDHPLRRELISSLVAQDVVNTQGPTFVNRLIERSGASTGAVIAAYRTARGLVAGTERRRAVEELFGKVDHQIWNEMMGADERLVSTLTRWHLGHSPVPAIEGLGSPGDELEAWDSSQSLLQRDDEMVRLEMAGVPSVVARETVMAPDLVHAPNVLEVARATGRTRVDVGRVFNMIGVVLGLDDLDRAVANLKPSDPWERWALETIEDDALAVRRSLAERILGGMASSSVDEAIEQFLGSRAEAVDRVSGLVRAVAESPTGDTAPLLVALRRIQALADDSDIG